MNTGEPQLLIKLQSIVMTCEQPLYGNFDCSTPSTPKHDIVLIYNIYFSYFRSKKPSQIVS